VAEFAGVKAAEGAEPLAHALRPRVEDPLEGAFRFETLKPVPKPTPVPGTRKSLFLMTFFRAPCRFEKFLERGGLPIQLTDVNVSH